MVDFSPDFFLPRNKLSELATLIVVQKKKKKHPRFSGEI